MTKPKTITKVKPADPPPGRRRYDWDAIAQQLRDAPGEWHLIFKDGPTSTAGAVRRGNMAAISPEEFEFQTSDNVRAPHRTCTLHMRYIDKKKGRK